MRLCSENELTCCSLQVLSPTGSPGRALLAVLADRFCSLDFLLHCLAKIDHQEAVQYLTSTSKKKKKVPCAVFVIPGITCLSASNLEPHWFLIEICHLAV